MPPSDHIKASLMTGYAEHMCAGERGCVCVHNLSELKNGLVNQIVLFSA